MRTNRRRFPLFPDCAAVLAPPSPCTALSGQGRFSLRMTRPYSPSATCCLLAPSRRAQRHQNRLRRGPLSTGRPAGDQATQRTAPWGALLALAHPKPGGRVHERGMVTDCFSVLSQGTGGAAALALLPQVMRQRQRHPEQPEEGLPKSGFLVTEMRDPTVPSDLPAQQTLSTD